MKFFRPLVFGWNLSEKIKNWYFVEIQFVFGWNFFGIWLKPNLYFVETFFVIRWNSVSISWNFFGISWNFFWYLVETFSGIMKAFSGMKLRWNRPILCPRRENTIGRMKITECFWFCTKMRMSLKSVFFDSWVSIFLTLTFILQYETRVRARVRVRAKVGWR